MQEFRPIRRIRQQLSESENLDILRRGSHGILAVSGDNGYPYAVPLSYVYAKGAIYFHSALEGHKVDALRRCNQVSFCVVDLDDVRPTEYTTYFRSVIAFGHVSLLGSMEEKLAALQLLGERFYPGHPEEAQQEAHKNLDRVLVIRMEIDHLSGKQAIELMPHHARKSTD